jgi:lipoyl(octanoyl) transferase
VSAVAPAQLQVWRSEQLEYASAWQEMRRYTDTRSAVSPDVLWWLEHASVFTQGQAGKPEHLLDPGGIPVVQSDRGGQVTWHGPGQLVGYLLLDLRRAGLGVRELVDRIEAAVIGLLATFGIQGQSRRDAPGVYVDGAKIAALGLRVRKGCSYHGLSLNVTPDLGAFARINPCGQAGLAVTRLADLVPHTTDLSRRTVEILLEAELRRVFGYDEAPGLPRDVAPDCQHEHSTA